MLKNQKITVNTPNILISVSEENEIDEILTALKQIKEFF